MTAAEFYRQWEGNLLIGSTPFIDAIKVLEFAEAYAKHDNEAKDKQIAELKESIEAYAVFCIECDRQRIKPLQYDGYLKFNKH